MIVFRSAALLKGGLKAQCKMAAATAAASSGAKLSSGEDDYFDDRGRNQKKKRYQQETCDSDDSEKEIRRKYKKAGQRNDQKWNDSNNSELIDEYEARPCLWNVFSEDYHNRDITGKAKKELEEIFNRSWKDISNQLTKLRQVLGQNINKVKNVKSGQSTDELFQPTWRYWKQLQFLVPCLNPRKSRDTLATESPDKPGPVIASDNEDAIPQAVKPRSSRQIKTQVNNHLLVKEELMKECINALKVNKSPNAPPPTAEEIFGNFVAEKLKALDRRQRIVAEKRITDILFDLEMESMVTSFPYTPQSNVSASHGQSGYPSSSASDGYHPSLSTASGQSALTTLYPWPAS